MRAVGEPGSTSDGTIIQEWPWTTTGKSLFIRTMSNVSTRAFGRATIAASLGRIPIRCEAVTAIFAGSSRERCRYATRAEALSMVRHQHRCDAAGRGREGAAFVERKPGVPSRGAGKRARPHLERVTGPPGHGGHKRHAF